MCSVCNIENCNEKVFEKSDKCILHCEKDDWFFFDEKGNKDWSNSEQKIKLFWQKIKDELYSIWYADEHGYQNAEEISYHKIIFPKFEKDSSYPNDYGDVVPTGTNFYYSGDAEYRNEQQPRDDVLITIINRIEITFDECIFLDKAEFSRYYFQNNLLFKNCIFKNDVDFSKIEFNEKFKFIECNVSGKANFHRTKFNKLAAFEKTVFYNCNFRNTGFRDVSRFINTRFKKSMNFKYTTFEKLAIFRDSKFEKNMNLKDSTFKEKVNFLDMLICNVDNRETARIIKDSFEQQNNIIEANKYYALEMKEREKELSKDIKNGKNILDWLVFKFHGLSSNHSQSWLLSLFWILNLGFATGTICDSFLMYGYSFIPFIPFLFIILMSLAIASLDVALKNLLLVGFSTTSYGLYCLITYDFNLYILSNRINPFSIMTGKESLTFGTLIFKVIISYLIYQFIISIRQNTRRK